MFAVRYAIPKAALPLQVPFTALALPCWAVSCGFLQL